MSGHDDVIAVDRLRTVYGEREVLRGVSLSVRRGEVFGLLGPNGAGKTTLLETVVGLRRPTSGSVRVLGLDPAADRRGVTERVAVQPQAAALFPTLTAGETMRLFASFHRAPRDAEEVLREVGLDQARRVRVRHLSGGQERRLLIGIALVGRPDVLVLDEPSAGLDPAARRALWDVIDRQRELGTTVLLSTHHMDEATLVCDRLAILVGGRVAAAGAPEALVREHAARATVSFALPRAASAAELGALGIPGEITTTDAGSETRVRVVTTDPDAVLRRITFTPGLDASGYGVRRGSLEDLFLDLSAEQTASAADTGSS